MGGQESELIPVSIQALWEGPTAVDGPPVCLLCVHSFFGQAFEKAAEGTNSRTLHNRFDFSGESPLLWGPWTSVQGSWLSEVPCQQPSCPLGPSPGQAVPGSSGGPGGSGLPHLGSLRLLGRPLDREQVLLREP